MKVEATTPDLTRPYRQGRLWWVPEEWLRGSHRDLQHRVTRYGEYFNTLCGYYVDRDWLTTDDQARLTRAMDNG